ncbi:DUF3578 domain-containing protein [Luteibacter sp. ME-Dv--P-043b]|uniref:MrcB family domain-containing protein n=1 Tax=Luteibacter sp. ME-Dv--P-043b TaxID=3040291 RepID=UPI002554766F|nr:DUF3578 domain-containing protein [Luteibacter sp. ME-Dv--P-043b]
MNPAENERFTRFLLEAAATSKRIGYSPTEMVRMLNSSGGYDAVSRLLGRASVSTGFVELFTRGRPDLTVEALVLESEWLQHFDADLISRARKRLKDVGYAWTEWTHSNIDDGSEIAIDNGDSTALSRVIARVLAEYIEASKSDFARHPLASNIRSDLPALIMKKLGERSNGLLVKGSAGQGNWARGPWIALFNPIVTRSAQSGYYVCLLFREDMEGVYVCVGQAMTEARESYRSDAKTALLARAEHFRAMLGNTRGALPLDSIDLAPSSPANDSSFYEAGIICAKIYRSAEIPDDSKIVSDLIEALRIYDKLIFAETSLDRDDEIDEKARKIPLYEDPSRFRIHKRVERNQRLVEQVKKAKGPSCEVCGMNFTQRYGSIGDGYIEAHHLRPVSTLEKMRTELDPVKDFAVLCSNCHRMIHRSRHVGDIDAFKAEHFEHQPNREGDSS